MPPKLDDGGQFAVRVEHVADRSGGGFVDGEHGARMISGGGVDKLAIVERLAHSRASSAPSMRGDGEGTAWRLAATEITLATALLATEPIGNVTGAAFWQPMDRWQVRDEEALRLIDGRPLTAQGKRLALMIEDGASEVLDSPPCT